MHDRSGRCVAQIVAGAERTIAIGSLCSEHSRLKLRLAQTHNVHDPFSPLGLSRLYNRSDKTFIFAVPFVNYFGSET
jgi:hypothetical protein